MHYLLWITSCLSWSIFLSFHKEEITSDFYYCIRWICEYFTCQYFLLCLAFQTETAVNCDRFCVPVNLQEAEGISNCQVLRQECCSCYLVPLWRLSYRDSTSLGMFVAKGRPVWTFYRLLQNVNHERGDGLEKVKLGDIPGKL